jgi:peptide/nickel transport system permease protein
MAATSPTITTARVPKVRRSEGQWALVFRRFRRHRMAMISLGILLMIFFASVLAPAIAPFPRDAIGLDRRFVPPSAYDANSRFHLLGTDHLGRDYFTRVLYAARVSLTVALLVSTIATLTGMTLGMLAGYFGGWVDTLISRTLEFVSTFPGLTILLIISSILLRNEEAIVLPGFITAPLAVIMAIPEREAKQVALIIAVLAFLGWTGDARLMRGQVLSVRENAYIESSRALGGSSLRILGKHVFPNAFPPLIVSYTLGLNGALVAESALSFLGFGIQDPTPTWGNMLAFANSYIFQHPWMVLVPGLPILLCSLAFNFVGDGLRDALDPRGRR